MGINERIRKYRDSKGMTRDMFGSMFGVSGDVVNNMERGRAEITEDRILLILKTFPDLSEDWLRYGKEPMKKEADIDISRILAEIGVNDPKACEAIKKYFQLSDEDKNLFWDFVERFMK